MNKNIKQTPRYLAVELLTNVLQQGTYSNLGLNQMIIKQQLSDRDAHLLTNIVYGVIQNRLTLEYYLAPFIKKTKKIDFWVEMLLLSAIYQMEYLDKIPVRAIFNESIEIAKARGHEGIRKYVTGILHSLKRHGVPPLTEIKNEKDQLSISSSTPMWLVEELITQVGIKKTRNILATINQVPQQSVRVNLAKTSISKVIQDLATEGYDINQSTLTPLALHFNKGFAPDSKAFKQGKIIVQDESAMLAVESMQICASDYVLDACAAPGGKTTQIAMELDEKKEGCVCALDIHAHKVKLIEKNAKRLGVATRVAAQKLDARNVQSEFSIESFDKILVDAPCSGIGLIRRKPEIKYMKTKEDSLNLQKIQAAILDAVAPTLKKGGYLTYSTCTILNTENQMVIDAFLKRHSDFEQIKTKTANEIKETREELGLTIYPDDYLSDGFFIATLRKK